MAHSLASSMSQGKMNQILCYDRGYTDIFNRRATGFHRQEKVFELNFFMRWSNQTGKIILTAGKFAWCAALNGSPV